MPQTNNDIFTDEEKEEAKRQKIADMEAATANAVMKQNLSKFNILPFGDNEINILFPDYLVMEWKEILPKLLELFSMKTPVLKFIDYLDCNFTIAKHHSNKYALFANDVTETYSGFFPSLFRNSLISIEIPLGIKKIDTWAFKEFLMLTSVTLPASITIFENYAFLKCSSITDLSFDGTVDQWLSIKGKSSITRETSVKKVKCIDGDVDMTIVIEDGIMTACKTDVVTVSIPNNVKKIGAFAFLNCKSLNFVSIPASVENIETSAFLGCKSLVNISFCGTVAQWIAIKGKKWIIWEPIHCPVKTVKCIDGDYDMTLAIDGNVLTVCKKDVIKVVIPDYVQIIGPVAFSHCNSLASVEIPISVIEIGAWALDSRLLNIKYCGTRAQWEKVKKSDGWNGMHSFTINCSDGDISIDS